MTAVVTSEPRTYEPWKNESFFADLIRSATGNVEAKNRLEQHQHEIDLESRTAPNTATGTGGEFAPPLWVIDRFAPAARAGRVLADLVNKLDLPAGVSSVHVPRLTTGSDAGAQTSQGDAVLNVDQVTADAGSNGNVVTVAGEIEAAIQLLDQTPAPGYDAIAYLDLTRAYNQNLETQMLAGSGAGGQLTGVQNWTSRNSDISGASVSATQATGVPQFWPLLGQAAAAVGNNRKLPAEVFLMAPRRWEWTAFLTVSIGSTAQPSPYPSLPVIDSFMLTAGSPLIAAGHPVYLDGAIPAGTSADVAMALRPSDMLLWESPPKFAADMNSMSGTLEVRLHLRRYVAFVPLQPKSITVITALPAPTSF